jgi:hypothetical protein
MAQAYREDARPKRHAVVTFAMSPLRVAGSAFALLFFAPVSVSVFKATETEASLTCTRAGDGSGTCTRTVKFLTRTESDTFDVQKLLGAQTKRISGGRGGVVYRTWLDVDGTEVPLGPGSHDDLQHHIGDSIDRFARTPSITKLDERYPCDPIFPAVVGVMAGCAALGLVIGALMTSRRRLRLDQDGDLATLDQRRFIRWRPVWSMPLSGIERTRVANGALVLETTKDGERYIPLGRDGDPAIAKLNSFLEARDSSVV